MSRSQSMTLGLCLAAVLIGAGLGTVRDRLPDDSPSTTMGAIPADRAVFAVYVSGWVAAPGVVEVTDGAIVADSVAAAGGALEGARLDSVNLARPLVAGDHVQIPGPDDSPMSGAAGQEESGLISLNQADATTLEDLPGVGPVLAERIVAYREANGPFETVEDLLSVPGIGEAKLASMRDLIVVP